MSLGLNERLDEPVDLPGSPVPTEIQPPVTVVVPPDTPLYCYKCHDCQAPEYRLRRSGGKYIALCFKNGRGCWEQSPREMCTYKDEQGVPCSLVSEFEIRYGVNLLMGTHRCVLHVAPALKDVGEHRIFAC
jgi:hypothetical protein